MSLLGGFVLIKTRCKLHLDDISSKLGITVFNVSQVAVQLGVCGSRVRQLAHSRHLGTTLGRMWIFTQADIEAMRIRKPGNPNKHRKPRGVV